MPYHDIKKPVEILLHEVTRIILFRLGRYAYTNVSGLSRVYAPVNLTPPLRWPVTQS